MNGEANNVNVLGVWEMKRRWLYIVERSKNRDLLIDGDDIHERTELCNAVVGGTTG